jgi:hypothetical protein
MTTCLIKTGVFGINLKMTQKAVSFNQAHLYWALLFSLLRGRFGFGEVCLNRFGLFWRFFVSCRNFFITIAENMAYVKLSLILVMI